MFSGYDYCSGGPLVHLVTNFISKVMKNANRLMFYEVRGALTQINDVLSGKNGKLWHKGILQYLGQGAIKAFGWKIYGPFNLRLFESVDVLMAALCHKLKQPERLYFFNTHDVETLAKQIEYPIEEEKDVEFVVLTVGEMGFENSETRLSEIEECLSGLGLELCKQSDAPRLFLSENSTHDKFKNVGEMVFVSKSFFINLRGKDDPQRPVLFHLNFSPKGERCISTYWSESTNKENEYLSDLPLYAGKRIVLRVKK